VLAIVGLGLASLDTPRRAIEPPYSVTPFIKPEPPFFIGAWVGPPTSTTDPAVWRRFRDAGLTVSFRGLEDPNDRARNVRTLALLDSLGLSLVPRDDAVHPDEMARPGWRDRVRDAVDAYRGHRSTLGYFVADEPRGGMIDSVAEVARAYAEADPERSAYVNFVTVYNFEWSSESDQARWRADAERMIRHGKMKLWSWSAYSQRRWGEDASFLLTLRNAMAVGQATGVKPIAILQFTGFQQLDPLPEAQLDYLAAEAIAHGSRGIVWFTYWTPNPAGFEGPWKGGAVEYDGTPSARADTLAWVNARARRLAAMFPPGEIRVAHFGSPMPKGSFIRSDRIAGLRGVDGGPSTVANYRDRWLVINRDRSRTRTFTLLLQPQTGVRYAYEPSDSIAALHAIDPARRSVLLTLGAGGSAVLGIAAR